VLARSRAARSVSWLADFRIALGLSFAVLQQQHRPQRELHGLAIGSIAESPALRTSGLHDEIETRTRVGNLAAAGRIGLGIPYSDGGELGGHEVRGNARGNVRAMSDDVR
jgi:hypothetical protein